MLQGRLFPKGLEATHAFFIMYALFYGVMILLSGNLFSATARWIRVLAGLSILTVLTALKPNQRQMRNILYGFLVGQQGLVAVSLYDHFFMAGRSRLRLTGIFPDIGPNATGMLIGAGAIISLLLAYSSSSNTRRVLFGAIAFVSFLAVLLTVTRGAIAAAIVPIVFLVLSQSARSWKGMIASLLIVCMALIVMHFAEEESGGELSRRFEKARTGTWSSRQTIWRKAFDQFCKSPIIGVGPAGALERIGISTHNEIVGVLLETGLVGIFLFIGWHASLFTSILKRRRSAIRDGRLALFIYVVLSGLSIRYRHTFVYFLLAIALEGWSHIRPPEELGLASRASRLPEKQGLGFNAGGSNKREAT